MIETGSMAPCLLGYHRQVVCPELSIPFAVEGNSAVNESDAVRIAGESGIAVDNLSRNDGDHLLVHRGLYEFRSPRRWEVVVFRNPNKLTQAYVKRLIALPGETVQIIDGDVYIGGEIQAKNYATQRGIRIPVYDHDFRPRRRRSRLAAALVHCTDRTRLETRRRGRSSFHQRKSRARRKSPG